MQDERAIPMTLNYLATFHTEMKNFKNTYKWPYAIIHSRISSKQLRTYYSE